MINLKIVCEEEKYMPAYANEFDACMDLKVKINDDNTVALRCSQTGSAVYEDTYNSRWVMPKEGRTFETGIQVAIPEDHVMLVYPRSSTGFKLSCMLANTTGVIDATYRDTIMIKLYNFGDIPVKIEDGQRVAQFMIIPRPKINLIKVKDDEEFRKNDMGGGIGSTGV